MPLNGSAMIARTVLVAARAVSSAEAESLGGKKAKTPIIAGSICGGIVLIAWFIGFAVYFRKRYNRKKRNQLIAEGKAQPREKDIEIAKEKVIIPPDPAVLLGQRKPGDVAFPEDEIKEGHHHLPWSHHGSHTKLGTSSSANSPTQSGKANSTPRTGNDTTYTKDDDSDIDEMIVPPNVKPLRSI